MIVYGFEVMPFNTTGVLPLKYCSLQGGVPVKLTVKLAEEPEQIVGEPVILAFKLLIVILTESASKAEADGEHPRLLESFIEKTL